MTRPDLMLDSDVLMDCLIAASALRIGKPFYTFNVKHYRAFPL